MGPDINGPRLTQPSLQVLRHFFDHPRTSFSGADIMKETGVRSGTLYPILLRFENHGILESEWEAGDPSELGRPRRRLYSITSTGRTFAWEAFRSLGVVGARRPSEGMAVSWAK